MTATRLPLFVSAENALFVYESEPLTIPDSKRVNHIIDIVDQHNQVQQKEDTQASRDHFCQSFLKTVIACLESKEAAMNNASLGLPSSLNAVLSTYPDNFKKSRLNSVVGAELFLFTAMQVASILQKKFPGDAAAKVDSIIKYSAIFSNGFSFAFGMGCKVTALLYKKSLPSDESVNFGVAALLACSLGIGIADCIRQKQAKPTTFSKISNAIIFGLATGSLGSRLSRMFNFFPTNDNQNDDLELALAWAPIIITLASTPAHLCLAQSNKKVSQSLASLNNIAYDTGTFFEAIKEGDPLIGALLGTKLVFLGAQQCVIKFCCKPSDLENLETNLLQEHKEDKADEIQKQDVVKLGRYY